VADYPNKPPYQEIALEARKKVLEMIYKAGTSHIGSNLSCIDLLAVLFPNLQEHDRFIASKGWCAASVYYFLAQKGIIPLSDLDTYCADDSPYIGLLEHGIKGVEANTGAMGHGLPIGVGMAIGAKRSGSNWKTYILMSDGEMQCGTTWESAAIASHHKLNNLTIILDYNKLQATGRTNEVLNIEPLTLRWAAFGWDFITINGHSYKEIECALQVQTNKPLIIIAHTVKGKGVPFMENQLLWHYKNIDAPTYLKALEILT